MLKMLFFLSLLNFLSIVLHMQIPTTSALVLPSRQRFDSKHFTQSDFVEQKAVGSEPLLIVIAGCTGVGKSTLSIALAHKLHIPRVISTDSIRSILRSVYSPEEPAFSPLFRSTYSGTAEVTQQWRECCDVLQPTLHALLQDALAHGTSLVLEGAHLIPTNALLDIWREKGGKNALGCLLTSQNEQEHQQLLLQRAKYTQSVTGPSQLRSFGRIRTIQEEMIRLAKENNWFVMNQQLDANDHDVLVNNLLAQNQFL